MRYESFCRQTPILVFANDCHGNHAFSHSPYQKVFEDTFVSHSGGPNKQFSTHEKLSWGLKGNLNFDAWVLSRGIF